jgi:hypothetical protein
LLLQVIIVVAFGAFCFGCGYLTAFIVTRNQWRDEMIKRGVARYNWHTGKWEWGESRRKNRDIECPALASWVILIVSPVIWWQRNFGLRRGSTLT